MLAPAGRAAGATTTAKKTKGENSRASSARTKRKRNDDIDDSVLVSMVTTWVSEYDASPPTKKKTASPSKNSAQNNNKPKSTTAVYSVHVTQLNYSGTEMEIREHFVDKGISIKSLRMVYDKGIDGRQFRGVAFVDFYDEKSYKLGLSLHKSIFKGRKINVRPTKSKEELIDIVASTRQKVSEKIKKYKEEKDGSTDKKAARQQRNQEAANRRVQRKEKRKQQTPKK
jgi:RNA recognition motif-containing protein